jgi:hypothetical protein
MPMSEVDFANPHHSLELHCLNVSRKRIAHTPEEAEEAEE